MFSSLASNSYQWLLVSPNFLTGGAWDLVSTNATLAIAANHTVLGLNDDHGKPVLQYLYPSIYYLNNWPSVDAIAHLQVEAQNGTKFTKLDTLECLKEYNTIFGNRSDLLMISSSNVTNSSILMAGSVGAIQGGPEDWMCGQSNTFSCATLALNGYLPKNEGTLTANWNVAGFKVDYCLASYRDLQESCSLVYSYRIMIGRLYQSN